MEAMMNQGQLEIPEGGIGDIAALSDEDLDQIYGPEELDQLASQGRGGDTMLAHVSPGEIVIPSEFLEDPTVKQRFLSFLSEQGVEDPERYVVGSESNSINPSTGFPEFFGFLKKIFRGAKRLVKKVLKVVKKVAKVALPVLLAASPLGAVYGSAVGTGVATLIDGGNFKDALKSGLKAGAMGALTVGLTGKGSFSQNIKGELGNLGDRFSQTYTGLKDKGINQYTKDGFGFKYDPKIAAGGANPTGQSQVEIEKLENIPQAKQSNTPGVDGKIKSVTTDGGDLTVDSMSGGDLPQPNVDNSIKIQDPKQITQQNLNTSKATESLSGLDKAKKTISNILTNDAVKIGGGLALLKAAAKPAEMELPSIGDFTPEGKPRSGSDELRANPDDYLISDLGQVQLQDGEYVRKPIFGGRVFNPLVDPSSTNYTPQVTQTELQATDQPIDKTSLMVAPQQAEPQQQQAPLTPEQQFVQQLAQGPDRRGILGMLQRGARNQMPQQPVNPQQPTPEQQFMMKLAQAGDFGGFFGKIQDRARAMYPQQPVMAAHGGQIFPRRNGGIMPYEGVPNEDSVRAMLMPGEFVMTKEAVRGIGRGDVGQGIKNMYSVMRSLEARDRRG